MLQRLSIKIRQFLSCQVDRIDIPHLMQDKSMILLIHDGDVSRKPSYTMTTKTRFSDRGQVVN
jgi:hypothetical protein